MSAKPKLWIRALVPILSFGILFVLILNQAERAFLDQARRDLSASVQEKAQRLGAWRANLSTTLIALAEQREIRETAAKIASGQTSSDWRGGFIAACNASFRAIQISHPAFENLSMRDRDGAKIAGSGAAKEEVFYPDLLLRIHQQPLSSFKEKWLVPIRDPQANPLAYVVADINLQASKEPLLIDVRADGLIFCLDDSSGHRIWDSNDTLRIPQISLTLGKFTAEESRIYLLAHAPIPGTPWILTIAWERHLALEEFKKLRGLLIRCLGGATIFLILLSLALSRRL
jgi:hypothetical protein